MKDKLKIEMFDKILEITDRFCKGIIFEEYSYEVLAIIDEYDKKVKIL